MVEILNNKITEFIYHSTFSVNSYKPKKIIKLKDWITNGIITSIRNREKLFAKLKSRPFDISFKKLYNMYRNLLYDLIRKSKQLYYQNKLLIAQSDNKQVWNIINEVIGKSNKTKVCNINKIIKKDGLITESKKEICNELNEFYVNVGNNLEIENVNHDTLFVNDNQIINECSFFKPISNEAIINHINKIKNNTFFYENELSNYILKNISNSISLPLSIIYNKSLQTGVYPHNFKKCIVIPLFKGGDKLLCGNYRPISLSITLSKIFEKCNKSRMFDFFK